MRRLRAGLLLLAAALVGAAPASARDSVRLLALSDALDPAVLDRISRALKADVLVDGVASAPEIEAAVRAPNAAYDLVLLPADAVGNRIKTDLLLPVDPAAVPEAAAVLPQLTVVIGPAAARVAVPYDWYPTGFAVNAAKLQQAALPSDPAAGWDVLQKPDGLRRVLACGFGWPEDARRSYDMVAAATGGDGLDRRRTLMMLAQLRKEARKGSAAERADGLMDGDLCAAVLPAPDALLAAERARAAANGVEIGFVLPAGGRLISVDVLAIPVAGRNHSGALALLRALMQPDAVAANARAAHVAPAVGQDTAEAAFDPAMLASGGRPQPPDAALTRAIAAAWEGGPNR